MKTTKIFILKDSRINRNQNAAGFLELCNEFVYVLGYKKNFSKSGWEMTNTEFKATAYKENSKDVLVDVVLAFDKGEATITVENDISNIDEEMQIWKERSNDEFVKLLKEIEETAFKNYVGMEEDEVGNRVTPISYYISAYVLDGNRRSTAMIVKRYIEKYDLMDVEGVKQLVDKMMRLAE
jgi:hypothetical protein